MSGWTFFRTYAGRKWHADKYCPRLPWWHWEHDYVARLFADPSTIPEKQRCYGCRKRVGA